MEQQTSRESIRDKPEGLRNPVNGINSFKEVKVISVHFNNALANCCINSRNTRHKLHMQPYTWNTWKLYRSCICITFLAIVSIYISQHNIIILLPIYSSIWVGLITMIDSVAKLIAAQMPILWKSSITLTTILSF